MGASSEYIICKNAFYYKHNKEIPDRKKQCDGFLRMPPSYEGNTAAPKWVSPALARLEAVLMPTISIVRKRIVRKQAPKRRILGKQKDPRRQQAPRSEEAYADRPDVTLTLSHAAGAGGSRGPG